MSRNTQFEDRLERLSASAAIRSSDRGLWIAFAFYSPKNKLKMIVNGIPANCHLLLCEGNPQIVGFRPISLVESGSKRVRQSADVFYQNGETETWVFSWEKPNSGSVSFVEPTSNVRWKCAQELEGKDILIINWIRLRAFMSAARGLSTIGERTLIRHQMDKCECVTIGELIDLPGVDCGLMLSEIATELASGEIVCELEKVELRRGTVLRRML
ncbi:hypothetical protein OKW40_000675 [Paraburkholderia sp. RAU6.4a]|uniref:hypothetical protein n=1 Tax=Paraburkholderia sp. RAU6.4a TaxID=2991067 RepID=UPI003D1E0E8E